MQAESAQHFFGAGEHALVFVGALLRRRDRDEFDLGELMLADHAARSRPAAPASARKHGVQAVSRIGSSDSSTMELAHEIRQRHFGGGDEPMFFESRRFVEIPNVHLSSIPGLPISFGAPFFIVPRYLLVY